MIKGPFDETVAVLADLHQRGTPLYALTNWSAETFAMARHQFEFLGWFDGIVVSGQERMAKPDEAIFRLMIERYQLIPERTVYIDDSDANVEQARRLGLDAIRFRSAAGLREDLRARDLVD
jgi:2-haloacid dehalogenase